MKKRVREIIDLTQLDYVVLLHFESDEYGGMKFLESPNARLVCSKTSSTVNLRGWFNIPKPHIPVGEGDRISLGKKKLRFLMTPHVHHWDSMMAYEETEKALFPSDLFLQPGDRAPVTNDYSLIDGMIKKYKDIGLFAYERPVRDILPKLERLNPKMIHAMHGSSLDSSVHAKYFEALWNRDFAYTYH